ncbi:MAG: hypothetical protein DCO96_03780 [Fluviicola sp. XM-24bin1]|nr:MAG: hypothetical protein DCO96_03780 [Fluviicola sp. XM-24bin1]
MAKIKLTPGQLYFLRERDFLTGEISRYVKIGLVRDEKETAKRIAEHQTGNPREIYDYRSIGSPFVEHVETLMHYWFAPKWITGEWFNMNEEEIDDAIEIAEKIIREQQDSKDTIERSYELGSVESTGETIEASEDAQKVWEELTQAKVEMDALAARKKIIDHKLRKALGNAGGIEGVLSVSFKEGGIRFDDKLLLEDHPELHEEYSTKETSSVTGPFTVKGKKALKKENPELSNEVKSLEKIDLDVSDIDFEKSVEPTEQIKALHADYINIQREAYIKDWHYTGLEARLKILTADSDGIDGLCGWKRELKHKASFDKKRFEEDHPELAKKYTRKSPDNFAVNIFSWRNYPT